MWNICKGPCAMDDYAFILPMSSLEEDDLVGLPEFIGKEK